MTVTLELTDEQERQLLDSAKRHDEATIREVLTQALDDAVVRLLHRADEAKTDSEFEDLADRLAASFTAASDHRPLSAEALSREGIYGSHP